ncbi:MAG: oligosaccharide flippase family protein [Clostridia bacterium]|nr:oligosaccharide flippase family protein [Clostridia bacterium]
MKETSRTENALLNIVFGYVAQIGIFALSFVGRRIFLKFLSADYLGINGLYSNILTILSLAELGLDTAVVYSLYKPVAEHDNVVVSSLLKFFKKVYRILALAIFAIGLLLIPFLRYLVTSDLPTTDLILFYVLFLINTVASYFVAHKVALLSASQEQRIQKIVTLSANLLLQVMHIAVLLIWRNYYAYLIVTVLSTILSNLILSIVCSRRHPEVFREAETTEFDKEPIKKRIFSTFLYKLGGVLITSTDNILISVLVSTVAVGFYSNYYTVVGAIQGFVAIITISMVAGIGNLAAKGTKEEQAKLFDMVLFFYHFVAALGLIGFSLLFNDLITIWLGAEYLFDRWTVFIIAFNFYLTNAISPVWMFREANGMFNEVKFVLIIRAIINIALSVILGYFWGVFGIFLATAVSLFLTNFWIEPRILSRIIFQRDSKIYWIKQFKYFVLTALAFGACFFVTTYIGSSLPLFLLKVIIICIVVVTLFFGFNFKTTEIKQLKGYFRIAK